MTQTITSALTRPHSSDSLDEPGSSIGSWPSREPAPTVPDSEAMVQIVRLAAENPDEAMLVVSAGTPHRKVVLANSAYLAMSGYAEGDLIGRSCRRFLAPHLEAGETTRLLDSLHHSEARHGVAVSYRGDGTEYLLDWRTLPLTDRSGRVTHYALVQRSLAENSGSVAA